MKFFDTILYITALILLYKLIIFIVSFFRNYSDNKIDFIVNVKRESILKMTQVEFEGFCKWLFSSTNNYKSIEVLKSSNSDFGELILTDENDEKIYVACLRHKKIKSKDLEDAKDDYTLVGRNLCRYITGAMAEHNIKQGIILTTGSIHENGMDFLDSLRENSDFSLTIATMKEILELLDSQEEKDNYRITVTI
ncbi:MAG: restriction endonuclease [Clostridium sp.]